MIRVHVICEGQTEEMFVNELLLPAFLARDMHLIPSLIGKPGHKGGNFKFERLYTDVKNRLLGDKNSYCTTLFDFYGLPASFPGKDAIHADMPMHLKAETVQVAMAAKLESLLGHEALRRFVPFVQMHEFEALLFSRPEAFASGIGYPELAVTLAGITANFASPEHINDSPNTAPSKRIEALIPEYQKPLMGTLAALEVGLPAIRSNCKLFNNWLERLETLPAQQP